MMSSLLYRNFKSKCVNYETLNRHLREYISTISSFSQKIVPETSSNYHSILKSLKSFSEQSPAHFASGIGHLSSLKDPEPLLRDLEATTIRTIPLCNKSELIKISRTYSRHNLGGNLLFKTISDQANKLITSMSAFEISRLLYPFITRGFTEPKLFEDMEKIAISSLKRANFYEIPEIVQTFSMANRSSFLVSSKNEVEKHSSRYSNMHKLHLIKCYFTLGLDLPALTQELNTQIPLLNNEELSLLSSYAAELPSLAQICLATIENSLISSRKPDEFSLKSAMLLINSFQEMARGELICDYFKEFVVKKFQLFGSNQYPLIVYVFGINHFLNEKMRGLIELRIKLDINILRIHEAVWIAYGLFSGGKLSRPAYNLLKKSAKAENMNYKDLEKWISVVGNFNDRKILGECAEQFKRNYTDFKLNKAIICLDEFIKADLMDKDLQNIMKDLKIKQKSDK